MKPGMDPLMIVILKYYKNLAISQGKSRCHFLLIHLMYLCSGTASDPISCFQCIRPYRSPPLLQTTSSSVSDTHTHTHSQTTPYTLGEWLSTKVKNRKLDDIVRCADVSSERYCRKSKQLPPPQSWDQDAGNLGMPALLVLLRKTATPYSPDPSL